MNQNNFYREIIWKGRDERTMMVTIYYATFLIIRLDCVIEWYIFPKWIDWDKKMWKWWNNVVKVTALDVIEYGFKPFSILTKLQLGVELSNCKAAKRKWTDWKVIVLRCHCCFLILAHTLCNWAYFLEIKDSLTLLNSQSVRENDQSRTNVASKLISFVFGIIYHLGTHYVFFIVSLTKRWTILWETLKEIQQKLVPNVQVCLKIRKMALLGALATILVDKWEK